MRKKIVIILILISIISLTRLSLADVDPGKCMDCHAVVKPLVTITKDCLVCHQSHAVPKGCCDPKPHTTAQTAHKKHENAGEGKPQNGFCNRCHISPVGCKNCHNSHEIVKANINKNDNRNFSDCLICHGMLPNPAGHDDFGNALSSSKHNWMNCGTCHLPLNSTATGLDIELHFEDLITTPINNSINLCKICHSLQFDQLKKGTHGESNETCTECHNPHTTSLSSPKFEVTKETENKENFNASTALDSTEKWITDKVPLLQNPTTVFIIFLAMLTAVSEVILSKKEEGKKTAYNMVKIHANEETLKTLEIKLKNIDSMYSVNKILSDCGNILGTTMVKENGAEIKYIVFIDIDNIENSINKISVMDDVKSVEVTDKYEL